MNEARERSYYEIALTNGQVLVAFGILLTCVAGAFVSGMWVARESLRDRIEVAQARLESAEPGATPRGAEGGDAQTGDSETFEFFGDEAGEEGQGAPEPLPRPETATAAAASSQADETPATQVASRPPPAATPAAGAGTQSEEPRATAEVASAPERAAARRSEPAEARSQDAKPAAATRSEAASRAPVPVAEPVAEPSAGDVLIQVFSGSDKDQASALVDRLRADGFRAFLSPAEADGRNVFRVRVGPYETREAAEEAAAVIRRRHRLDTWFPRS